jgi:hypothetical protein
MDRWWGIQIGGGVKREWDATQKAAMVGSWERSGERDKDYDRSRGCN